MNVFKGETCSGKSTLINSIIGEEVLPKDFKASTKHVCRMKYSDTLAVITRYNSRQEETKYFPTEEGTAQLKEFLKERVTSSSTTISCVDVLIPSSKLKARTIKKNEAIHALSVVRCPSSAVRRALTSSS